MQTSTTTSPSPEVFPDTIIIPAWSAPSNMLHDPKFWDSPASSVQSNLHSAALVIRATVGFVQVSNRIKLESEIFFVPIAHTVHDWWRHQRLALDSLFVGKSRQIVRGWIQNERVMCAPTTMRARLAAYSFCEAIQKGPTDIHPCYCVGLLCKAI